MIRYRDGVGFSTLIMQMGIPVMGLVKVWQP